MQKTQDKKRKRRDRQREKRELLKAPKGNDPLPQPKKDEGDNDKQEEEDEDEKDLAEKMIRIRLFPNEGQKEDTQQVDRNCAVELQSVTLCCEGRNKEGKEGFESGGGQR